jgi:hypothetical protein
MKHNQYIIKETAVFSAPEKIKKYLNDKVIFETFLQEADEVNQNKRLYEKHVISEGMDGVKDKVSARSFLGELDHPITENQIRQTTVLYKECSHLIREYGWEGNLLKGVVESTPYTENGRILSGLILDKVNVGFSMRGIGDIEDNGNHQKVMSPLMIICFDAVSDPSAKRATVQEIRNENIVRVIKESKQVVHCDNGQCYLTDYFDKLVESKMIQLRKRYW